MKIGIIQSRGLGDLVISLPIADYYRQQGHDIYWPIARPFMTSMTLAAPWVNWIPLDPDPGSYFYDKPKDMLEKLACDEIIPLYQALTHQNFHTTNYFQHTKFDQYKYIRAQVPFEQKWRLSDCVTRHRDREQELFDKITASLGGQDRPYILVHVSGSDHRAAFDTDVIPKDIPAIEITELTDSIWDWLMAIERASAVICVDSVYSNIIDQMRLLDDDSRYFIPRSHIGLTPVLGCYWTWLDNLNLSKQAQTIAVK